MFTHRPRLNAMGAAIMAAVSTTLSPLSRLDVIPNWVGPAGTRKVGNNRKMAETSKRANVKAARLSRKRNEQRARGMKV